MGYYDDLPEIDINERLEEMALFKNVVLVDVRAPWEYKKGHVPGAINVDSTKIKRSNKEYIESIFPDKEARIYMYCHSGSRSGIASAAMRQMGYWRAENIGGYLGYTGTKEIGETGDGSLFQSVIEEKADENGTESGNH